jgi:hypothetical protein
VLLFCTAFFAALCINQPSNQATKQVTNRAINPTTALPLSAAKSRRACLCFIFTAFLNPYFSYRQLDA